MSATPAETAETAGTQPAASGEFSPTIVRRIAMILPGRADDLAWNAAAYRGLEAIGTRFGIETAYVENVADADVERVLRSYADQGYDLIIAHSFSYGDAALRVAQDYPDAYFLHGQAPGNGPNVVNYSVPSHEGGYLAGLIAGSLTTTDVIGIVNSFDVPSMVMIAEGFKLGVAAVNPGATVLETYVGAWDDAAGGREAAEAQISAGADFIMAMGNHTGMGAIEAAQDAGILAAGCFDDQNPIGPDVVVTSIVSNFGPLIERALRDIEAGTYGNQAYVMSVPEGAVELAPFHSLDSAVPQSVRDLVNEAREQIISGELVIPMIETKPG